MLYLGVDIGGTNIKAAVVSEDCAIISHSSRPTKAFRPFNAICDDILLSINDVMDKAGVGFKDISGLGLCAPGMVDGRLGQVLFSGNLGWDDAPIREFFLEKCGLHAVIGNDANAAALAEACAGCAKDVKNAVIITLGTGVGGGVIVEGSILIGSGPASEPGHMAIIHNGEQCTCGRRGCWEAYASITALVRMTKEAMEAHPRSELHRVAAAQGSVSGRTAFDAMRQGDPVGSEIVDRYIGYVACGITNMINLFYPDIVAISGGISKERETLLSPLRKKIYPEVFGSHKCRLPQIEICALGENAGVIGAAMLSCK